MDPNLVVSRPDAVFPAGARPITPAGSHGEQFVGDIHPPLYEQAKAGNLFWGGTLAAGTTIPVSTATAATFVLWNPLGSGKNLVLYNYYVGFSGTTTGVIAGLGLGYLSSVGAGTALPTGQTALTPVNGIVGGGNASVAKLLSVATIVAATYFLNMGLSWGTTTDGAGIITGSFDFKGGLILPPGVLVHVVGTVAQSQPCGQTFVWAEEAF